MNTDLILRLLKNSGFNILGSDGTFLYLEDPSCILRSFETFIEYAWIGISCITILLLFGWAISMIRGIKNDISTNLRNLVLMFGTLSVAIPIINTIWGDDLFAYGCRTIKVSIAEVNEILETRKKQLSEKGGDLYEEFYIYDSGSQNKQPNEIPYSEAPLIAPDVPSDVNVSVYGGVPNTFIQNAKRAKENGRDVIYTNSDGSSYRKTGGTRSWRNNNPGNLKYYEFARKMGAIGQADGFAVFPDEETGMRALNELLRSNSYNKLTIAGAINKYAPKKENNVSAYLNQIQNLTGLSINKRMVDLTESELSRVANAILKIEGWETGQIIQN